MNEKPMREDTILTAAVLLPKLTELYKDNVLHIDGMANDIQVSEAAFRATFPEYEATARNCGAYPYELSVTRYGAKFLCVSRNP